MEKPSVERVRELFTFNPYTGELTRQYKSRKVVKGRNIEVDGHYYAPASIGWLHHFGRWPNGALDHKDKNKDNNKITNLREATTQQNAYNVVRYNPNNAQGVTYDPSRKKCWRAQIRIDGVKTNLGRFMTKEEAAEAYRNAALKHHGEFACVEY